MDGEWGKRKDRNKGRKEGQSKENKEEEEGEEKQREKKGVRERKKKRRKGEGERKGREGKAGSLFSSRRLGSKVLKNCPSSL